ncbi:hypothetical protein SteCoe_32984 [Stentor coeruleus]|uniref:Uncharacterized protein n=1 Tax=Stentor coeruleus TaxID=5963 RepID=A0A1R2AXP8_9CILI|nr:hypothetical protein SteCoe_32984 [Stentor coeruleus]
MEKCSECSSIALFQCTCDNSIYCKNCLDSHNQNHEPTNVIELKVPLPEKHHQQLIKNIIERIEAINKACDNVEKLTNKLISKISMLSKESISQLDQQKRLLKDFLNKGQYTYNELGEVNHLAFSYLTPTKIDKITIAETLEKMFKKNWTNEISLFKSLKLSKNVLDVYSIKCAVIDECVQSYVISNDGELIAILTKNDLSLYSRTEKKIIYKAKEIPIISDNQNIKISNDDAFMTYITQKELRMVDIRYKKETTVLAQDEVPDLSLDFTMDSKELFINCHKTSAILSFNIENNTITTLLNWQFHMAQIRHLKYDNNNKELKWMLGYIISERKIIKYSLNDGKYALYDKDYNIFTLNVNSLYLSNGKSLIRYNLNTDNIIKNKALKMKCKILHSKQEFLITVYEDFSIDIKNQRLSKKITLKFDSEIYDVKLVDRKKLLICLIEEIHEYCLETNKETNVVYFSKGMAMCGTLTSDNQNFAIGCSDGKIKIINLVSQKTTIISAVSTPIRYILSVKNYIIIGADENSIRIFSKENIYREISILNGHTGKIVGLSLTFDNKYLISASDDRNIKVWNLERLAQEASFNSKSQSLIWEKNYPEINKFSSRIFSN